MYYLYIMNNLYNRNEVTDDLINKDLVPENTIIKKKYNKTKGKPKIKEENFKLLKMNEYEKIFDFNYNIQQLKTLCRNFKVKVSGNKSQLQNRLYKHMRDTYNILKIQSIAKTYLTKKYITLNYFSLKHRKECVNECDFLSLEPIKDLPYYQIYCFKDNDNFIYGFDLCSLYNLLKNSGKNCKNPFNRKEFPDKIIKNIRKIIKMSRILKLPLYTEIQDDINEMTKQEKLTNDIENVFHIIDDLGFYTNAKWFMSLNVYLLHKYVKELRDIWRFRLNIPQSTKLMIYPYNNGNPFYNHLSLFKISQLNQNYEQILFKTRRLVIDIIKSLVDSSDNNEYKKLGALYCLTALTLVNKDAAESMPWLYLSAV